MMGWWLLAANLVYLSVEIARPASETKTRICSELFPIINTGQWRRVIFDISILDPFKLMKTIDSQGVRSEHPRTP